MATFTLYTGFLLVAVSATAATAGSADVATGNSRPPADVADDTHDGRTKYGTMYVVGSVYDSNASRWTMETYDGETRKWTVHKLPEEARGSRAAAVDGQLYVMGGGGYPGSRGVRRYDPTTDTWETQPNMTADTYIYNCVAVLNNTIYSMGSYDFNGRSFNYAERRDPATGEWSPVSSMTTDRVGCRAAALNGYVYVVGGLGSTYLRTVEKYDPATDRWTPCAEMSTGRAYMGVAVLGGHIYAVGGLGNNGGQTLSSVERYDPQTDRWTPVADLPVPRHNLAAAAVGGRLMAVGGFNPDDNRNRVDSYDPASDTWTQLPDMILPRSHPGVAVIA